MKNAPQHPITQLIHHPCPSAADGFAAPQPPVHKASTIFLPDMAAARGRNPLDHSTYTYGTHGTPTSHLLEQRLCALEGGKRCLLFPSGLAAIACVNLALLNPGDEVLMPDNVYGPNKTLAMEELKRWGIRYNFYEATDTNDLAAKITPATKLVWLEAAGSITLEFPDLAALVTLCRSKNIITALDNTWGAGLAFSPFDLKRTGGESALGVDISIHALTKYPSGGGHVLMGSVMTRDDALFEKLGKCHMHLGFSIGMNDVETVLAGLPSISLRYKKADENARAVAQWCRQQPQFAQVLHPSLPDSPGHTAWQQHCCTADNPQGGAAGIVSVILDDTYTQDQVDAFCESLQLFRIGYSWGGPVSLVMAYNIATMRDPWPQHLRRGKLVRLCTGLEDATDLLADLGQAMRRLPKL